MGWQTALEYISSHALRHAPCSDFLLSPSHRNSNQYTRPYHRIFVVQSFTSNQPAITIDHQAQPRTTIAITTITTSNTSNTITALTTTTTTSRKMSSRYSNAKPVVHQAPASINSDYSSRSYGSSAPRSVSRGDEAYLRVYGASGHQATIRHTAPGVTVINRNQTSQEIDAPTPPYVGGYSRH
ncbi:hypothetical protein CH63R_06254 [Colletotrichum higginsianum IMI 349063]|uniref:Uncharacterized protein n=2 Tax=Colletotrichum destructivum species complex TaxID=2707350 RepID=A0A1B7YEU3_COLHI|nr:hypothetical protein CH63R_06254 [Colletotrichum higginsianum IMI 349063]OBR10562.1 hypothetical protein CH63R_06254 [Colletotrichum higginsianum IMI 349063]